MILADTGPLVALLHKDDQDHQRCVEASRRIRVSLATTWAVRTEAMYLLEAVTGAQEALLEMIQRRALLVLPLEYGDVPRIRTLMRRYRDLPMDFADATLVRVAERERLDTVFTLDVRDFATYRLPGRRAFRLIP